MKLFYLNDIRQKIIAKGDCVSNAHYQTAHIALQDFFNYLNKFSITKTILSDLDRVIDRSDFSQFHFGGQSGASRTPINIPLDEKERLAFYYKKIKEIGSFNQIDQMTIVSYFGNGDFSIRIGNFINQVFVPVFNYILEQVQSGGLLLNLLIRFKVYAEWFETKSLFDIYSSESEGGVDSQLRKFLFLEGIDYPFSKPRGASGV